jgi:TRIAD3 protein (E3 ubiquitin-protein ligase RNF216)
MMAKLDSLQQQDDIMKANLDGLEDCPFCEFKAIYPPPEEDREFRCLNPDCEMVSCRLCKGETHIPKSCKEVAVVPERRLVEEAMTAALVRTCPTCNVGIVKEDGCDSVTCTKCQCSMCYICRQDISSGECNCEDEGEDEDEDGEGDRSQEEINDAQRTAIQNIRAKNPQLSEEELRVQFPADRYDSDYYWQERWSAPWRPAW